MSPDSSPTERRNGAFNERNGKTRTVEGAVRAPGRCDFQIVAEY